MKTEIIVIFATFVVSSLALTDSQIAKLTEIGKPCREKSGVSEDVIKKLNAGEYSEDSKLKKYLFCNWKNVGLVGADGDIVEDKLHERVKAAAEDEQEAETICEKCKEVKKDTYEETLFEVIKCLRKNLPSFSPIE